jgi:branched-chain amino acid transport system permease protein
MLMIILGGAGTFFGPLIGAFAIVLLSYGVSSFTEHWSFVLGAIYVAVIVFAPDGVAGMVARRRGKALAQGRPK